MTDLFTKAAHHKNVFVIFIKQLLYDRSPENRTRQSNAQYMVLFQNLRDATQISILGRQLYPSKEKFFVDAYNDTTAQPNSYLLVDFHSQLPANVRLRAKILVDEAPMVTYVDPTVY